MYFRGNQSECSHQIMNLDKVLAKKFGPIEHRLSEHDCILYSLGIGIGADPVNPKQLQFVYEKNLKVFPSHTTMMAHPGPWLQDPDLDIDYLKLLHVGNNITLHKPFQPNGIYIGRHRVLGVVDKGTEKGALLYLEKTLSEKETDELAGTVASTLLLRGDGGCGSSDLEASLPVQLPVRNPDRTVEYKTADNAALIYRLSGDLNALHIDPEIAKNAGFKRPILHGLCSFGIATRAVIDTYCDSNPEQFKHLALRFSSPVIPGEKLRFDFWEDGTELKFVAINLDRNTKALNNGIAGIKHK